MKTEWWAIALVAITTLFTSVAQIMYKIGVRSLTLDPITILTNYYLIGGLSLYVLAFVLLMAAYKGGEASVIYPIFSSSYVWVVFLSAYVLGEALNVWKVLGVVTIVAGIIIIARGSTKDSAVLLEDSA